VVVIAYLGVGANLGRPEKQLQLASALLVNHCAVQILKSSSMFRSAPIGRSPYSGKDLGFYVNAVWQIRTSLSAYKLLSVLKSIELRLGRKRFRGSKNLARTVDLDLLLYGAQRINTKNLTVPHQRMHQRRFVLEPLAEITPRLLVPGVGAVQNLIKQNYIAAQAVELLPS
jgi:2-amino-4-hydroxy-6-hydroxymethyldihydropteridine diphosphokinase